LDLTKYFPKPVFNSFPPSLKTKIHHAKNGGDTGGKRNIHAVKIDDMRSQVSSMADELAQVRAVMQASHDNQETETTSAASAFGRPGQPPHKKPKAPRAPHWLIEIPSYSTPDSDDDSFHTANSDEYTECGNPFHPSDHFFDALEYTTELKDRAELDALNLSLFPSDSRSTSVDGDR
jgi:hypothetical protein